MDLHRHQLPVALGIDDFAPVGAPEGVAAGRGRKLPAAAWLGEGGDVELEVPRLVGRIGQPAAVG